MAAKAFVQQNYGKKRTPGKEQFGWFCDDGDISLIQRISLRVMCACTLIHTHATLKLAQSLIRRMYHHHSAVFDQQRPTSFAVAVRV